MLIRLADLTVELNTPLSGSPAFCDGYRVADGIPDFSVSVSERERTHEQEHSPVPVSRSAAESVCLYRKIGEQMPLYDGFLLHAAVIADADGGYAFSAPSGTGKSTHISYWKRVYGERVRIVNGDKPLIRLRDGIAYAYGSPWCGKEGQQENTSVPLKALCFLERAERNSIVRISAEETVDRLFSQLLLPPDAERMSALLSVLDRFVRAVPCFRLGCNLSENAAVVAYEGMRNPK